MQVTSIFAILIAVTGALAAPGHGGSPPPPPPKPAKPAPPPPVVQQITCSSGSPYCCNLENDGNSKGSGASNYLKCSQLSGGTCNAVTICCNNNNGNQNCGSNVGTKVVFI